jgi:hypothetical protein
MTTHQQPTPANQSPADNAGPHAARTAENPIGIDDIGLPSGIQPSEVGSLDEIDPTPDTGQKKKDTGSQH